VDHADPFDGYSCHVQMHGHKTGKKLGQWWICFRTVTKKTSLGMCQLQ
jgi:hypothetical protein